MPITKAKQTRNEANVSDNVPLPFNLCATYASFNYVIISRLKTDYTFLSLTELYYLSVINVLYPNPFSFKYFATNFSSLTRWNDRKVHVILDSFLVSGFLERIVIGKRFKYHFTAKFDRFRTDYIKQYEYLSNRRKHLLTDNKVKK